MYLVVIAWLYVVVLMSIAEATNTTGTVLGAIMTFVLYGALPVTLVVYLMGAPARNKAIKKRHAAERDAAVLQAQQAQASAPEASPTQNAANAANAVNASIDPDAGSHSARGAAAVPAAIASAADASASITTVRKEP